MLKKRATLRHILAASDIDSNGREAMQTAAYKEKDIISALVSVVQNRKKEAIAIEQVLNEAGINQSAGLSIHNMLEVRAKVLYALNISRYPPDLLKSSIIYFIADHPVFRWSELRYFFKTDSENNIEMILNELKYMSRALEIDGELEFVWSPRWLWTRTVRKKLDSRKRVGEPAFFEFLNYKPKRENT